MANASNPLGIQELLGECIQFLRHSPSDLKACASVSRAWACASHPHLFREVSLKSTSFDNDHVWSLLCRALRESPHLIRHIHRLSLNTNWSHSGTFSAVCSSPFTHLTGVSIYIHRDLSLSGPSVMAVQQLFSLPTLRSVEIRCKFSQPSSFLQIWNRCSANIKDLELFYHQSPRSAFPPIHRDSFSSIRLESFRIKALAHVGDWLTHNQFPFDFAELKVLSIETHTELLRWPKFAPALPVIEALDFIAPTHKTAMIDLSALPELKFLRISVPQRVTLPMVLATLSTIVASNQIRKIVIHSMFEYSFDREYEQLDALISSLPMLHPPIVDLETEASRYNAVLPFWPHLNSQNKLCRTDYDPQWFKVFIHTA
ncbi:hypothetical protein C8R44DRAFT_759228 [Mycena epipterygia]|nr:hypothetical protein C8R44DRAFT_759228 [Mycena epipterygia]